VSLAETQFNLADAYYRHGDWQKAHGLYQLASPVLAERAQDAGDARAQLIVLLNDTGLGRSLYQLRRVDEAEAVYVRLTPAFATLDASYENIRVSYAVAQLRLHHGELLASRGEWRRARPMIAEGVARLRKIGEVIELEGDNLQMLRDAEALLAKAEAAVK
jgi:tetratricopeptide (TPR) repeat protein